MVEAAPLELLIRAVHLVIVQPEAEQQAVDAQQAAETGYHGDAAAAADQHRGAAVFLREHRPRRLHEAATRGNFDAWCGAEALDLDARIGRQPGIHEGAE